jgi:hypothetical protein
MNRPEDDPVIVALIASNLLGRRCRDWSAALSEARSGLRQSRRLIADENEDAEIREEAERYWRAQDVQKHGVEDLVGRKRLYRPAL